VVPLPRRGTGCSEGEKLPRKCAVCAASVGKSASSDRLGSGLTGDAGAARALYAELLLIRERVLGPEHPDVLDDRARLADWTGKAGDTAGARALYAELLPIRERVLGPEHPRTQAARADLAYWTRQAAGGAEPDAT
jgi:hypothetical protein